MHTTLNETIVELKLRETNVQPNLSEVLRDLKLKEINYYRTKVVSMSEAILEDSKRQPEQEILRSSLCQLEALMSA
ncbi:MAG: hypothetical protein AB8B52_08125 [Winogradskyella sp.]|uniref:hypothetical protein n=1 Tax=Winogradskyella sp. TaxID=1883156 RepID=UPI003858DDF1